MDISSIVNPAPTPTPGHNVEDTKPHELINAIRASTPERNRSVLTTICFEQQAAFDSASQKLLADQSEVFSVGDPADDESASEDEIVPKPPKQSPTQETFQSQASTKSKRYEICDQCDKEYDVVANNRTACVYHRGYLEVYEEDDFWADHDEDCHGEIDTDQMREDFPEGFQWDCCGRLGDRSGCKRGPHRPKHS